MKYTVKVNGVDVPLQTARVSALPLNKLWDGEQRPVEQTEEAYFVSFDLMGSAVVEIEVEEPFVTYELRPRSFCLQDIRQGNRITLQVDRPMQFTFETDGRHRALHVFANPPSQKPMGRNVLYYGKGEHKADLIWMQSDQTLYIDEGAVVYGVVYAKDAQNIRIMGRGVLDSSPYRRGDDEHEGGREVQEALLARGLSKQEVKYCGNLVLNHCHNVVVEGIVLRDAPLWSLITRNACRDIVIDNVKLIGQWRYNADGIDICNSSAVTVKNCFVRSFDDSFVARGAYLDGESGDVEDVTVENCVFWCDWGKSIELWCGHKPTALRRITVRDSYLIHISASAINIATWFGSEATVVEGVVFRNLYIDGENEYDNLVCESAENRGYRSIPGFIPRLTHVSVEKLGKMKGLGTQLCEPVTDFSEFHIAYRDILYDNVCCDDPRLGVDVCALDGVHTIEDVRVENSAFTIAIHTRPPQTVTIKTE